jgi:hypothetical protein
MKFKNIKNNMKQIKDSVENLIGETRINRCERRIKNIENDIQRLEISLDDTVQLFKMHTEYTSESIKSFNSFLEKREKNYRNTMLVLTWSAFFCSVSCLAYFFVG